MSFIWNLVFGFLTTALKPVFDFLNKRVDAKLQTHIIDQQTLAAVTGTVVGAETAADKLKADVLISQGKGSPLFFFMGVVLAPLIWHEWQVVLDSSRWVPVLAWGWGVLPYPWVLEHQIGSWKVAALPAPWDATEQAIFQSLFIGASAAATAVAAIRAVRR